MQRAVRVSLKSITEKKRRQIAALLEAYRGAVNFYIRSLWKNPGGLNKETLARLQNTRLSERYKSQALKQALEIVTATKKSAKAKKRKASLPKFKLLPRTVNGAKRSSRQSELRQVLLGRAGILPVWPRQRALGGQPRWSPHSPSRFALQGNRLLSHKLLDLDPFPVSPGGFPAGEHRS